jgi:uncharacterized membrane protein YgcG
MIRFLGHPYFLQFCVPLIAVTASVFLRFVTRSDVHKAFKKEDLAVGLDLSVTALLIFIAAGSKLGQDLAQAPQDIVLISKSMSVPWVLAAFIVGIWGVSTIVRKLGWEDDDRLRIFWGIVVPDVFGLLALIFVVNWIA